MIHESRDPSNMWAISFRYQARIVSGLANQATCAKAFRPEALGDLDERGSLWIGQPQSGWQVCPQNAILGSQVFVR
jgi:hypothetical protein